MSTHNIGARRRERGPLPWHRAVLHPVRRIGRIAGRAAMPDRIVHRTEGGRHDAIIDQ